MIVPRPARLTSSPGRFTLDADTAIHAGPGAEDVADLLRDLLRPATGLPLRPDPDAPVRLALDTAADLGPEGYELTVTAGAVRLRASRTAGLLHGVQTIRQLLPAAALSPEPVRGTAWELPAVHITDRPAYGWRGAMVDVARHFRPPAFLRRFVDLIALHKLNTLHLHLTDDQGWRMPIAAYPALTEAGAVRSGTNGDGVPHGGAYTVAELRDLIAYANRRGVTVIPEIEMPGHARAALAAYPHLGNRPDRRLDVWTRWGICETVLGVHDEVLEFCRTVLGEVMDVFPGRYVHVGGEECPGAEWEASPAARDRAAAEGLPSPDALHGWFLGKVGGFIAESGRSPVCWAEDGGAAPDGFTVMAWRRAAQGLAAARRGRDVVMTPHLSTYLDYPQTGRPAEPPGQSGAVVDLRSVFGHRIVPDGWEPSEASRVLGTQGQLWGEYVPTDAHAEYLAFPRLCALAEGAWSPGADWAADFLPRLARHATRLRALGVPHGPLPKGSHPPKKKEEKPR